MIILIKSQTIWKAFIQLTDLTHFLLNSNYICDPAIIIANKMA
jgi:hypothetical protein